MRKLWIFLSQDGFLVQVGRGPQILPNIKFYSGADLFGAPFLHAVPQVCPLMVVLVWNIWYRAIIGSRMGQG